MAAFRARLKEFDELFEQDELDLKKVRRMSFYGCPDAGGIRAKCWKLLLNYLPSSKKEWPTVLEKQRTLYKHFIDEMIVQPGSNYDSTNTEAIVDHPLNPNPDSQWVAYFKDNEMLMQIDKDCRRLCPDLSFFQQPTEYPCPELMCSAGGFENLRTRVEHSVLKSETVSRSRFGITNMIPKKKRSNTDEYATLPEGQEAHWEVCERILFIYAKLNPGQGYVQGMNEIVGPIYYVFSTDTNLEWREHAEADCFFCFTSLMSEIRDNFIKSLDDSEHGIGSLMNRLMETVKAKDVRLHCRILEQNLRPEFYAFRWLTLLLSQEFPLPDVLRLWDSLFADEDRYELLVCICCAMLILVRTQLLDSDFPAMMKLVQTYPVSDIQKVISKAAEIAGR
ncbi:TBC1 domain family member 13-like [Lineus longissimus]|uniref:TBC1 domain family member 13-like n=1 Tax=Lineus longissimus TaxID=88925 RepID=UPI00315D66A0